jgi:hypothetical protein
MPRREKLVAPTIHSNGTSARSLQEALQDAALEIEEAKRRLYDCAPHGRDYYVQPEPDALATATAQFASRVKRLDEIHEELVLLHEAIQAQQDLDLEWPKGVRKPPGR